MALFPKLLIRKPQLEALRQDRVERFASFVRSHLAETYPHFLPRFPATVQRRIVSNMLERAEGWGFTWQSNLLAYCQLMISIAANFDDEPRIRAALTRTRSDADAAMSQLPRSVPEDAWTRAEAAAQELPFFVSPALAKAPPEQRTAAALRCVLWEAEASRREELSAEAVRLAERLRWQRSMDAAHTLAAASFFYGAEFYEPKRCAWARDVFRPDATPGESIALLQLRIAIDHGRMI
jgi:hypothetical protein